MKFSFLPGAALAVLFATLPAFAIEEAFDAHALVRGCAAGEYYVLLPFLRDRAARDGLRSDLEKAVRESGAFRVTAASLSTLSFRPIPGPGLNQMKIIYAMQSLADELSLAFIAAGHAGKREVYCANRSQLPQTF